VAAASHTPKGLRTPKAAGIPPLLWLSLVLVPPMLTETITPSYPVAGDRSVRLGPCTTRHLARARERSKSWASKDTQLWHNGLHRWRSMDTCGQPRPPPGQYAVKGTLCRALSSVLGVRGPPRRLHGVCVDLEEALWATKKIPENSVSTLATTGDPRADVSAKGSCPQAPSGVARVATPTVF